MNKEKRWKRINPEMFDETIETISHHTKHIASFIKEVKYKDLPPEVINDTKRLILDTIGCAIAGRDVESSKISRMVVDYVGGKPLSTIVGTTEKISPPFAALANAKAANALDLDDCFMNLTHFAPQVVMVPFAIGESLGSSGKDFILSVVIGYEIAARIALSANFWKVNGGLITAGGQGPQRLVFGASVFGAAAAAAKDLRLDEEEVINAFGVCGHFAPLLIRSSEPALEPPKYGDAGHMAKYCDAGWSSFTGAMSALYAKMGYFTNCYTLDGRYGYIRVMGEGMGNSDILADGLRKNQKHWYISDSALKTYPCCKYVHTPLHLFIEIIKENDIQVKDIRKVIVHFRPSHAVRFSEQNIQILKGLPCTHNIPYNLAMAALGILPNRKWHSSEKAANPEVRKLMKKIVTKPSGEASLSGRKDIEKYGYPRKIYSRVEVYAKGEIFSKSADRVKGDPWWKETRFNNEDLSRKLEICAEEIFDKKKIGSIVDKTINLEKIANIAEIAELLKKGES